MLRIRLFENIAVAAARPPIPRQLPDKAIASILNRAGKATGRDNGWTRSRVCWLRNHRGIAPYRGVSVLSAARSPWRKRPRSLRLAKRPCAA